MSSTAAEHDGAMADGGEAWKMRYLGSKDVTTASTRCRRARRSYWRLIAGRGGAPTTDSAGGAAVALCSAVARGGASTGDERAGGS